MRKLQRRLRRFGRWLNYWSAGYPVDSLYHEHLGSLDITNIRAIDPQRFGDGVVITRIDGSQETTVFTPRDVHRAIHRARRLNRVNRVFAAARNHKGK